MKLRFTKMLLLAVFIVLVQVSGYAHKRSSVKPLLLPAITKTVQKIHPGTLRLSPALSISYHVIEIWETTIMDNDTYIEWHGFKVQYAAPLPYAVNINYSVFFSDSMGDTETVYDAYESAGATSTYLGSFETYHDDNGYFFTQYLVVNSVQ